MPTSLASIGGSLAASAGASLIGGSLGKGASQPSVGANGDAVLSFGNGQLSVTDVGVDNGGNSGLIKGLGTQVVQSLNTAVSKLNNAGINVDLSKLGTVLSGTIGYNKAQGGYFASDSSGGMQGFGNNSAAAITQATKNALTQAGVNVNDPNIQKILGITDPTKAGVGSTITTPFGNIQIDSDGNVIVNDTANLTGKEQDLVNSFFVELQNLQGQLIPGQGLISKAIQKQYDVAKNQLDNANTKAASDLEGNLSVRNIAGSSFGDAAQSQRQAQYEQNLNQLNANKATADAQAFMQELDLTNTLIGERAKLALGAVQDSIKVSQFDTQTASSLSKAASSILAANARLQQQLANQIQVENIQGQNALNVEQAKEQFQAGAATAQSLAQPLTSLFNDAFSAAGSLFGGSGSSTPFGDPLSVLEGGLGSSDPFFNIGDVLASFA